MSLKVWLPLTGNAENKGSLPVSPVVNGATVNTSGKLGKCYSFDGNDDYISLTDSALYPVLKGDTQPFSIAMWIYHADSTRAILFGDYNLTGSVSFNIELTTAHIVRFYWAGSPDYATNVAVASAGWTHIVITYDGSQLKTYKDGVLSNIRDGTLTALNKTTGAYYLGRDSRTGTTALNGRLNDFRIYDHVLSIAEIKDLAKGLILHYKLDSANNNLLNMTPKLYSSTSYNAYQLQLTENLVANQTYTLQFWDVNVSHTGKDAASLGLSVYWGGGSVSLATRNGTSYFTNGHSDYMAITFTPSSSQASGSGATNAWLNIYNSVPSASGTMSMRIGAWKIEKGSVASPYTGTAAECGNIIEDCSGNGYNATVTGSIDMVSSAKNSCAVHMNNTSTANKILGPAFPADTPLTVSLWVKCSKSNQVIFAEYTSDIEFGIYSSLGTYNTKTSKNLFNLDNFTADAWNHVVVTKNGTTYGMYINGIAKTTSSTANYYTHTTDLWLLNRNANTSYAANASISDFRVYATLLSAEDIQELYLTEARVDNGENIQAYNFSEAATEAINNTGIITGHEIYESPFVDTLKYDKTIYTEPDGSKWVRIFHHNNPASTLFSSSSVWRKGVYVNENVWFDIYGNVELAPKYELMVKQKTTSSASEVKYRWIQNVSPLTAVWDDVKPANVTRITTSGYTDGTFGGLFISNNNTHMVIANSNSSNWYGATGSWTAYQSGIPGYPSTTITSGYMDIYLRIYTNAKFMKNTGFAAKHLIEM